MGKDVDFDGLTTQLDEILSTFPFPARKRRLQKF